MFLDNRNYNFKEDIPMLIKAKGDTEQSKNLLQVKRAYTTIPDCLSVS